MRYFYVSSANQAVGPVDAAALVELRRQGVVDDDTRVSKEGDTAWRTYADFFSATPPALEAQPRPVALQVFGICNIFFGSTRLLCMPFAAVGVVVSAFGAQAAGSPLLVGWTVFSSVFGLFLALALLISGIGLLRFRSWGRTLALAYCLAEIAHVVAGAAFSWKESPFLDRLQEIPSQVLLPVVLASQLVIGLAYPLVMFFVLRLPSIKDAFRAQE